MSHWLNKNTLLLSLGAIGFGISLSSPGRAASQPLDPFVSSVLPVLVDRCLHCHGETEQKGGLRLDSRAGAIQGGDSGAIWSAGDSGASELVRRIITLDEDERMPPKGAPLTSQEVEQIRSWIDGGANWPDSVAEDIEAHRPKFWSLRPLENPSVPELPREWGELARNPVDAFVFHRLKENQLSPSGEASRRILIRRLYYDVLGLPPSPAKVERFVADPNPRAYEQLVDELLSSPAYGERWARHWLDVVHFGESHGYDKDKPRPNAWPYRDYVIRALNDDRSYSEFVSQQLAGDVLYPDTLDGITATGFIAAGPWDFVGHAEVPETKVDGRIARHLDRDDMVATTMNTFTSLTVQCARCHNHKFDPVDMKQYYSLQAVFAAVDRSDTSFDRDPKVRKQRQTWAKDIEQLEEQRKSLVARVNELGGDTLEKLDKEIRSLENPDERHPAYGYHSHIESKPELEKWVQVDLGEVVVAERIEYFPAHDDYNGIGAGFGFPVRYRIEISDQETFEQGAVVVADATEEDVTNPLNNRQRVLLNGKPLRFVRITATKLAPRSDDFIFALAEMTVLDSRGKNLARGKNVTALDSIEQGPRWGAANLVDGIYPGVKQQSEGREVELASLRQQRKEQYQALVPETIRRSLIESEGKLKDLRSRMGSLPAPMKVFVGHVHTGNGAFRGTGHEGGKPREIRVLHRGDITSPGEQVDPGAVALFAGGADYFQMPDGHDESERRVALSRWILDPANPLTWRSIANRVWQYHFGRGIVDSPNDFGRMGQRPTHPELLDWLAVRFRDGRQSLKDLHRLIVTSATYRQRSQSRDDGMALDAGNRFLWRMNRRRLDAESIRDSVLALADSLDTQMYGPSFQDFVIEKPEHSPHYQYHLHDPRDPRSHRRSVYRFLVRSQQQPFMTTLDCADPSMLVDKRSETLTPLQALSLLNNRFMTAMAMRMGEQLLNETNGLDLSEAFYRVTGRPASDEELQLLETYADEHGAANVCRLLLNLNEFIFVD